MKTWAQRQSGFTIVELLIVVVVIAILAAITIVAYSGIRNQAEGSRLQSVASQAGKSIAAFAVRNVDTFPTSIDDCPSPAAGAACIEAANDDDTVVYVTQSTGIPGYCYSVTSPDGTSYYVDQSGNALPGTCDPQSCYDIQQAGSTHGSGMYWIRPAGVASPMPAFCDMEYNGGGWTLLMTAMRPNAQWNTSTIRELNTGSPSLDSAYSIVGFANDIKSNISGNVEYRLEAGSRQSWGGIFTAPYAATLEGTSAQNVATMTQQFSTWTMDTDLAAGTSTLSTVVPWIDSSHNALTTWGAAGNWYGTIVTSDTTWNPGPYITPQNVGPGVVWYWVR